jgi:hypothetical protein
MAEARPAPALAKKATRASRKPTPPKAAPKSAAKPATRIPAKVSRKAASKPAPNERVAPRPDTAPKAKPKLVRDSFTIPKAEYAVLGSLKDRALSLARSVKKSELLRAGIVALKGMHDEAFLDALNAVPSLKTGRPKHAKAVADVGTARKG